MKKIKNIVLVLSMLTLSVSLFGCADKANSSSESKIKLYDDSNSYENPNDKYSETNAPGERTEGKMNEKTAFKDCEINMTKVTLLDNGAESENCYAAIFEITNNSNEEMEVSSLADFIIKTDDGKSYEGVSTEADAIASKIIKDAERLNKSIKAGETFKGFITFKIPSGWKNLEILYIPGTDNESKDSVYYNVTPDMITES